MASTSNSGSPPPEPSRNWLELPPELTAAILQRVGTVDVLKSARRVCRMWRRICADPSMWRVVNIEYVADQYTIDLSVESDLEKMARLAVDLSCGQLIEFNMEHFGSDDLVNYVADRSSQLKRLRLVSCYGITTEGFCEMVKKLPLLEDLHLYYIRISKVAIEVAGSSCPLLKSFKFNNEGYRCPHIECDEEALAVAVNMPGLRHLQLFGNKMTSTGLLAILQNCPHLESLDMRQCFNVANLGPDIGKRLAQQIKYVRYPNDHTRDYEYDAEIHDWASSEEDYPSGLSDIDIMSDDYASYEFSEGSDMNSDYEVY